MCEFCNTPFQGNSNTNINNTTDSSGIFSQEAIDVVLRNFSGRCQRAEAAEQKQQFNCDKDDDGT